MQKEIAFFRILGPKSKCFYFEALLFHLNDLAESYFSRTFAISINN